MNDFRLAKDVRPTRYGLQFAARPVIFPDAAFAARYDRQARENLARELASLR